MSKKYEYLIYNCISGDMCKSHVSFHMPGHKGGGEFAELFPEAKMDITELGFSDNLHCPTGVIKQAQDEIAEILGAYRSYITTDGSTSGVYAMLYAAAKRGKKVIIPRNAHKSVYNACRLFNIEPVIIQGEYKRGVMLPPKPEQIEQILLNDSGVAAYLAVSPDYYGNIAPLEQYKKITKKYRKLLLVDGAHGAHLAFENGRRGYCGVFADMWVDGAHKTLPTLTQGAVLNIASAEIQDDAEQALSMFRTTSPSYPIMASVEYGVKFFANNPKVYEGAKAAAEYFKNSLKGFTFYPSNDWCKIAVDFSPLGVSADEVMKTLERENIHAEMCDGRYILFYVSPLTEESAFQKLIDVLCHSVRGRKPDALCPCGTMRSADSALQEDTEVQARHPEECRKARREDLARAKRLAEAQAGQRKIPYLQAVSAPWEYVPLDEAEGRICAENAGITPPCTPLVAAGEVFTQEVIALLKGDNVFGIYDGKVKVTAEPCHFERNEVESKNPR